MTYAYAHTNTQLYKFDPAAATLSMQLVGTFDCIGSGELVVEQRRRPHEL